MNLHFRKSSCIAIGAFNVYIIQPEWMAAKGFFDPDSEVSIETKLDEPGFRFSQEGSTVRWVVTPTRIAVETEDEGINCGAVIARILNLLPETPITAVGNNSFFQVFDAPTPPSIPSPECESAYNVTERVFHIGLQTGKTIFNLGLR